MGGGKILGGIKGYFAGGKILGWAMWEGLRGILGCGHYRRGLKQCLAMREGLKGTLGGRV